MIKMFPDVDGVMFVRLDYGFVQKLGIGGTGSAGIMAYGRIKVWNKEGDNA